MQPCVGTHRYGHYTETAQGIPHPPSSPQINALPVSPSLATLQSSPQVGSHASCKPAPGLTAAARQQQGARQKHEHTSEPAQNNIQHEHKEASHKPMQRLFSVYVQGQAHQGARQKCRDTGDGSLGKQPKKKKKPRQELKAVRGRGAARTGCTGMSLVRIESFTE